MGQYMGSNSFLDIFCERNCLSVSVYLCIVEHRWEGNTWNIHITELGPTNVQFQNFCNIIYAQPTTLNIDRCHLNNTLYTGCNNCAQTHEALLKMTCLSHSYLEALNANCKSRCSALLLPLKCFLHHPNCGCSLMWG